MNTFVENIKGYNCIFEICGNNQNTQFTGRAEIEGSCLSQRLFFTLDNNYYPTENNAREYLRGEIRRYLNHPCYLHPIINSKPQSIGSNCVLCDRIISGNDGWRGAS
jgi:hypothetical protein